AIVARRAGQRAQGSGRLSISRCRRCTPHLSGATTRGCAQRLVLLESEAQAPSPIDQRHPEEGGAVRQGGRHPRELPQLTPHLRLKSPGRGRRSHLHQRADGPCLDQVERAVCETLESTCQAGLLADDEKGDPENPSVRRRLSSITTIVAHNSPRYN